MKINSVLFSFLIALLTACAAQPYLAVNPVSMPIVDIDTHEFVLNVTASRHTQRSSLYGRIAYGIYLGNSKGCDYVAVILTTTGNRSGTRNDHYQVCGQRVSGFQASEVAPSYPKTQDAMYALNQAINSALLYGVNTTSFQTYQIRTERLGSASLRECQPVEVVITYENMLSYYDRRTVCQ